MIFRPHRVVAATLAAVLTGCSTQPPSPPAQSTDETALAKALKEAATRAVAARVQLASMKATPIELPQGVPPEQSIPATARIDIDYVGPVENAVKLLSRTLGWDISVAGKKRSEVIVSLRHEQQDAITILRDIGTQCGHRCDVHVEVVEGGKSSIALSHRD